MSRNPYLPPTAEIELPATGKRVKGFPFSLVARWLISAALVLQGGFGLVVLARSWAWMADRAIIDSAYSPWPVLVSEACVLLTGLLLFRRSRWVFVPLLIHLAVYSWRNLFFGGRLTFDGLPALAFLSWGLELALLAFCLWLWTRGRLR